MGGFKRFLLFLVSLVSLATILVLGMPWFGYGGYALAGLIYNETFWIAFEVCAAITVGFLVFCLGYALLARKHDDTIKVMSINGGEITVTKAAVSSQAGHIVEALGVGTAKDVDIIAAKNGKVDVKANVVSHESIDITAEAPIVHDALVTGLTAMCGDKLGIVSVEFLEPKHGSSLVELDTSEDESEGADTVTQAEPVGADVTAAEVAPEATPAVSADTTGDITIPMRSEKSE